HPLCNQLSPTCGERHGNLPTLKTSNCLKIKVRSSWLSQTRSATRTKESEVPVLITRILFVADKI
ncbi:MAG: hypothetical protein ACHQT8_04940, partial [Chlamydiales bacterium]